MHEDIYKVIEKSYNSNTYYEDYRKNRKLTKTEKWLLDKLVLDMPSVNRAVLDVGCGDASLYDTYLYETKYCNITGIDISEKQLSHAKDNLVNCKFIHGNFLDVADERMFGRFDGVVCMYALFNFIEEDMLKALQLMNQCLRRNGVALINVRKEHTVTTKYSLRWCGEQMYWSLPGVTQTLLWCTKAGFTCRVYDNPDNSDYVFVLLRKE